MANSNPCGPGSIRLLSTQVLGPQPEVGTIRIPQ